MNRIDGLFQEKKQNILSVYFTAGFPNLDDTLKIITALEKAGVDQIEIGIPFSDPLADGPVIQQSSQKALQNGMSVNILFSQIQNVRNTVKIPLILMGYLNPILRYGMENFLNKASEVGIDGLILPDLPLKEYLETYKNMFDKAGIFNIMLITPQTRVERIRLIDEHSGGFIYMVSSAATTGTSKNIFNNQSEYFRNISAMNLSKPRLIGFGISDRESYRQACLHANGAIIGTAFIKSLEESASLSQNIDRFIGQILNAE